MWQCDNVTSAVAGQNVVHATANNAADKKSGTRKAKNNALMEMKKEDDKIILFYVNDKKLSVEGKMKRTISSEVFEACECTSMEELRQLYQIRLHNEETMTDITKTL